MTMTLHQLVEAHPEWLDKELVVLNSVGEYEWIGASGDVYPDDDQDLVVFTGN